jgi:hypothetical protein
LAFSATKQRLLVKTAARYYAEYASAVGGLPATTDRPEDPGRELRTAAVNERPLGQAV